MDIGLETAKIRRLIEVFKRDIYGGGLGDKAMCDAAKEIFKCLDAAAKFSRGDNLFSHLITRQRREFELFVVYVYTNASAPELQKLYFEYKRKHP